MSRQTVAGVIDVVIEAAGRPRYEVRLADGQRIGINQNLIVPEPAGHLPVGTWLMIEHEGGLVVSAQVAGKPNPRKSRPSAETRTLEVNSTDPAHGLFIVTWEEGKTLRLYMPPRNEAWQHLLPGSKIEVSCKRDASGHPQFSYKPPDATSSPSRRARRQRSGQEKSQPADQPARAEARPPRGVPAQEAVARAHSGLDADIPPWEQDVAPESAAVGPTPAADPAADDLGKPIPCPPMSGVFAAGGPVSSLLGARYHPREGQVTMADQIRETLLQRKHAIIEAGTGIGKSFAYLIPVIWSGARAVVSTSNKALMTQLWHKDLPALGEISPRPFTAALLKGRSNYICDLKLTSLRKRRLPGLTRHLPLVEAGLEKAPSGDLEEMGLPPDVAAALAAGPHECEGTRCASYARCFYERARAQAAQADIVITNHALLCMSMLRHDNKILPVRPVLIIDEAHELPRYAVSALTEVVEHASLFGLVNHALARRAVEEDLRKQTMELNQAFFKAIEGQRPDRATGKWALTGEIQEGLKLWKALGDLRSRLQRHPVGDGERGQMEALVQHADEEMIAIQSLSQPEPEHFIRYCEMSDDAESQRLEAYQLQYQPLEVAGELATALFEAWPCVICTSATLSIHHDLRWFQRQVGAPMDDRVSAQAIPSPFDYRKQVLLYTPQGLTPVYGAAEEQYVNRLASEIKRLIEASRGRTFVLCTSRRRMHQLYEMLQPVLSYSCYCQGTGLSRRDMVEHFTENGNAVLFGTRQFLGRGRHSRRSAIVSDPGQDPIPATERSGAPAPRATGHQARRQLLRRAPIGAGDPYPAAGRRTADPL